MTTFPITVPFPVLLDDPQAQIVSLPSHPAVHIAPLRNPVPSRAFGVPTPLEPNAAADEDERALGLGRNGEVSRKNIGQKRPPVSKRSTEKPTSIQALIQPPGSSEKPPNVKLAAFVNLAAIENKLPLSDGRSTKRARLDIATDHLQLPKLPPKESKPPPFGPFAIVNGLHEPPPGANLLPPIDSEGEKGPVSEEKAPIRTESAEEKSLQKGAEVNRYNDGTQTSTGTRKNLRKWTEEETCHLLKGVAKYGVGKWKQIKADAAFNLTDRSTVDLKDRFRVCCPNVYNLDRGKDGQRAANASQTKHGTGLVSREVSNPSVPKQPSAHASRKATARTVNKYTTELARLRLGVKTSAPSAPPAMGEQQSQPTRRARRRWSQTEDSNLLAGLSKHGMAWSTIQKDPELCLFHRRPQDLRDRIRTRFPDGYKLAPSTMKEMRSESDASTNRPKESSRLKDVESSAQEGDDRDDGKEISTEAPGLPSLTTLDGWDWDNNTLPPLWEEIVI